MRAAKAPAEDLFEAKRKAFFSSGDESSPAVLPQAQETVFAKEIPSAPAIPAAPLKNPKVLAHA